MQGKLGDFDIIKTIGTGASCKVKLGIDGKTGKKVAIKMMNPNLTEKDKNLL
jgi:serine/threonine protein kinase